MHRKPFKAPLASGVLLLYGLGPPDGAVRRSLLPPAGALRSASRRRVPHRCSRSGAAPAREPSPRPRAPRSSVSRGQEPLGQSPCATHGFDPGSEAGTPLGFVPGKPTDPPPPEGAAGQGRLAGSERVTARCGVPGSSRTRGRSLGTGEARPGGLGRRRSGRLPARPAGGGAAGLGDPARDRPRRLRQRSPPRASSAQAGRADPGTPGSAAAGRGGRSRAGGGAAAPRAKVTGSSTAQKTN